MILNVILLVLSALLMIYLVYAIVRRRNSSHDSERLAPNRFVHRGCALVSQAYGHLYDSGVRTP